MDVNEQLLHAERHVPFMDVNELSELQNSIDIKSSDIYKICYIRHQIIITNPKYYLN